MRMFIVRRFDDANGHALPQVQQFLRRESFSFFNELFIFFIVETTILVNQFVAAEDFVVAVFASAKNDL